MRSGVFIKLLAGPASWLFIWGMTLSVVMGAASGINYFQCYQCHDDQESATVKKPRIEALSNSFTMGIEPDAMAEDSIPVLSSNFLSRP